MNYHRIDKHDMNNGEGIRTVLWVSGCEHKCKGCHNPQTWKWDSGKNYGYEAHKELMDSMKDEYVDGITFSGGDPLFAMNAGTILSIMYEVKKRFPSKTFWLYTGYRMKQLKKLYSEEFLIEFDVIVDGKFIKSLHDSTLKWRGSSNQRVYRKLVDITDTM